MTFVHNITIFLFLTSIPAMMGLNCYSGTIGSSTLNECDDTGVACKIDGNAQSCATAADKTHDGCKIISGNDVCFCTSDG